MRVSGGDTCEGTRACAPKEGKVLVRPARVRAGRLVRYLLQLLRREVGCIRDGLQARHEWRVDLPDLFPVDAVEERVGLDLVDRHSAVGRADQPGEKEGEHLQPHGAQAREQGGAHRRMMSSASRLRWTSSGNMR